MEKNEKSPLEILAEERKNSDPQPVSEEKQSEKYDRTRRKVTFYAVLFGLTAVTLVFTAVAFGGGEKREKEVRDEVKFSGLDTLKAQLELDRNQARYFFMHHPNKFTLI